MLKFEGCVINKILNKTFYPSNSYPFKRGKSKVASGRDTSKLTTTIWQASWRIIQMVFLRRSELDGLNVSHVATVNKDYRPGAADRGHTAIKGLLHVI